MKLCAKIGCTAALSRDNPAHPFSRADTQGRCHDIQPQFSRYGECFHHARSSPIHPLSQAFSHPFSSG